MFSKQRFDFIFFIIFCFLSIRLQGQIVKNDASLKDWKLQTENLVNPIGIDAVNPRLRWIAPNYTEQIGYQIQIATDSLFSELIFDSQRRQGDLNQFTLDGVQLLPYTGYFWRVRLWDENEKSLRSPAASFEMGQLDVSNWKGAWISDHHDQEVKPAPYFRKAFSLSNKKIKSARAYVAAAGLYELYINGEKIGNHRLDPAYTRFDRRLLYVTYDVTKQLMKGDNVIGTILGNGWYNHQSSAVWFFDKAPWRNRPAFCLDLRITYDDGTTEFIATDKSWKTALGPTVFNSIYTAEHYDARLEMPNWCTNNFDESSWKAVNLRSAPAQKIVAQVMPPIRNTEKLTAAKFTKINDTTYVYDFGRNIAGVSELRVKGEVGTRVRLIHGERLKENGHVDLSNINVHYRPKDQTDPFQTDIVYLSGKQDQFMPKFNYKGFQYVEVVLSRPISLTGSNLIAYFMHSDVEAVGKIHSSNPTLDKIWQATNNAYLSNLFGYPTDCPQREKNGWTGDAHIAIETALYNFDGIAVYEKWINDHLDEQQPNGVLPAIIPTSGWGYQWANGTDWTSTIAIIPWNIYLFYHDTSLLEKAYPAIKKYVDYIDYHYPSGLTDWGLGDWVPVKAKSDLTLTSSIYYYVDATILAKTAKLFGHEENYWHYAQLAEKIKAAINRRFYKKDLASYGNGTQTELSMPLYWKIVPEEEVSRVASQLAEKVKSDHYHLDVGLLGTKSILNALSEHGYGDIAYRVASQEDYPSWGWWIKNGATTLYENWNITSANDISLNHIMFGEIGAWYYKGLGGLYPKEASPGFQEFDLKPFIPDSLNEFAAEYQSVQGKIAISWKRSKKDLVMDLLIPNGSQGHFVFPKTSFKKIKINDKLAQNREMNLKSGKYKVVFY